MNHWFLIAIGLWITIVIPSWMRVIWIGVFGIWLERKKRKTCLLYVICLILLSFPWIKTIEQPPETLVGTVTSLKNSGFIVTTKQQNVWVNRNAEVGLDDEVVVACELQKINSLNNRVGYSFEEWANHHHIWYQCKSHSVNVIKKGNTLRAKAFRSIRTMPLETAKVMNMFVFHLYESDSDWLYLGLSLGIQISFLLQCIRKLASYFLKERTVQKVLWFVTLCIGCFYRFDFLSVRYLIRDTLKFTSWNKKEQWGILWVILLCLFPNEATELKFLIPMGIGLISCFGTRNHSIVVYCYIILLQLYQNGVVAIDSFVYMFLFRPVFSMMYLFCVLRFLLPIDAIFPYLNQCLEFLQRDFSWFSLELMGKPSLFVCVIVICLLVGYQVFEKKKYLFGVMCCLVVNHMQTIIRPYAMVHYLDVGQGDCTLIVLPFHQGNILVDTGGNSYTDLAKEVVYPVLKSFGIHQLDLVILTHDDFDHSGAYSSLRSLIPIKKTIIEKRNVYALPKFQMYDTLANRIYTDENENSLTMFFDLYGVRFLILGDCGVEQEKDLVEQYNELKVDVLKVAHHGSKTSTSMKLLETIQPHFALISVGANNRYHHPSSEIMDRLKAYRIPFWQTSTDKAITVYVSPLGYTIKNETGKIWFSLGKNVEKWWRKR